MSVNLITRDEYPLSKSLITKLDEFLISILSSESIEDSNINVSFISSEEMRELNKQFRGRTIIRTVLDIRQFRFG